MMTQRELGLEAYIRYPGTVLSYEAVYFLVGTSF